MAQVLKSIVVAGATGGVGRHCINILVRDERVGKIYALTRGDPKDPAFYNLEEKSDDLSKLEHLKVDYNGDLNEQFKDLKFDAGLSCIGVYTSDTKNVEDFKKQEYEPNLKVAKAAAAHGATRWAYLSGMGVEITDQKKWNQPRFSYVKGRIEADLQDVFDFVNSARPGFIAAKPNLRPGFGGFQDKIGNYFQESLLKTKYAVHRDDISIAMVDAILNEELKDKFLIYENEDIKAAANKYKDSLQSETADDAKQDEVNEEEPKEEEPKPEEPKQEEPKSEEVVEDEPKQDESGQDDAPKEQVEEEEVEKEEVEKNKSENEPQ